MTSAQVRWAPALSEEQIESARHLPLFEKWWKEEGQLGNIRTYIQSEVLDNTVKECQLFASAPQTEQSSLFFPLKEKLNRAIDLLQIFFEVGKNIKSPLADEPATQLLFKECLDQIKPLYALIDTALPHIESKFSFPLNQDEIESFVQQLRKKHQKTMLGSSPIPPDQIDQSCNNLQISLHYILQHFAAIRRTLLTVGRNLIYFSTPACPNPFAVTTSGKIYLILFDPLNNIGKGTVKRVFRCIDLKSKRWIAAIKATTYFPKEDLATQEAFSTNTFRRLYFEANVLKGLGGQEGIMQLYDILPFQVSSVPEIFIFEELFEFQDLRKFLQIAIHMRDRACFFSTVQQNQIALLLLKVLATIHRSSILHRSIKPDNFLLKFDWDPKLIRVVVTDFEDSCLLKNLERRKTIRPLPYNYSPEYARMKLNEKRTDEEIIQCNNTPFDVWDMGVILYQLFLLKYPPWFSLPIPDQAFFIAKLPSDWAQEDAGEHPIAPLLLGLLEIDPAKRLTAEGAVQLLERLISTQTTEN
ncbi:MAG: hypothetical protein JSR39_02165 [Verrucomicrobia bacterium]|nr:hypothetical protein [Verrucomicrobiota bacterium]